MLTWILKISIASICFIFLVHHLICFLKNTLTIPKTKDLVNSSSEKYNKMYYILENNLSKEKLDISNNEIIDLNNCTSIDSLPVSTSNNHMKEELKFFLKNQLNTNNINNNNTNNINNNTNNTNNTNNLNNIENYDMNEALGRINYSAI